MGSAKKQGAGNDGEGHAPEWQENSDGDSAKEEFLEDPCEQRAGQQRAREI
jgi:hypothetical protein